MLLFKNRFAISFCVLLEVTGLGCEKTTTAPSSTGVADLLIVNAIPNTNFVIPVINSGRSIEWFSNANDIYYGGYYQYSALSGNDTIYVVQGTDTLDVGPKSIGQMFYGILPLRKGGIYSLFLCGADTASPDYLFTNDTLPYHSPSDSTVGIRFVNLSTGSNPISINLEGSPNGSEVNNLPYKGITGFRNYISNSSVQKLMAAYTFVFRDVATGDSLLSFSLGGLGSIHYPGIGLYEPYDGAPLVFKNITIALVGEPGMNASLPQNIVEIDNY